MTAKKVPAGNGWLWISKALDVLKKHPVPFLVMGLIMGIIGIIPVLGGLVLLILGPALVAGTSFAAQQADQGKVPEIGHLFRGFQESDRIGSLIALCIPTVVGAVMAGILVGIFAIGAAMGAGAGFADQIQSNPMVLLTAMGASAFILGPLLIIVALMIYALTFFAIPRTLLERPDAFANMKDSLAACRTNFGAFLVAVVILLAGVFLLSWIFGVLHLGVIGGILVSTGLYAVLGSTLYFGFREVFGGASGETAIDNNAPPAPPPATSEPSPPPAPS
ncbi:MAG: BPSS1780 family membrane protein, partial [Rhodanobacteraceae bacterium]